MGQTALNGTKGTPAHTPANTPGGPPVTQHPAFPAIVALWFAALLGLGSMVLPASLLEAMTSATGLSSVIPGAAPPLGFTARGLIALVAAAAGAATGLILARKLVAGQIAGISSTRLARATHSTAAPRPINAHAELGSEGLDQPLFGNRRDSGRRRALSVTDEARTSDLLGDLTEAAPLPTAEPEPEDLLDLAGMPDEEEFADGREPHFIHREIAEAARDGDEPVTTFAYFDADAPEDEADESADMHDDPDHASGTADLDTMGMTALVEQLGRSMGKRRDRMARAALASPLPAPTPAPAPVPAPVIAAVASLSALAESDMDMARPEEAAQAMAAYFGKPAAVLAPRAPAELPPLVSVDPTPAEPAESGPEELELEEPELEEPELEELAPEELAIQDLSAEDLPDGDLSGTAVLSEGDGALELDAADEAEPAMVAAADPAPEAAVAEVAVAEPARFTLPAFLVPHGEDDDDDDLTPSFTLPARTAFLTPVAAHDALAEDGDGDEGEAEDEDAEAADESAATSFGSLLNVTSPFSARSPGVRVDEPEEDDAPVSAEVVFPGKEAGLSGTTDANGAGRLFDRPGTNPGVSAGVNAGADSATHAAPAISHVAPAEVNEALKSALAKLQRMSGAA